MIGVEEGEPVALVVLKQRVRPDAHETLEYFERQGVSVKIVSGDDPRSVSAIAAGLNVPGADRAVDARTLPDDEDALGEALDAATVFGRVSPPSRSDSSSQPCANAATPSP
ncbi:hypothetical protein ACFSTC_01820 [Nonomuraea ferruginea]